MYDHESLRKPSSRAAGAPEPTRVTAEPVTQLDLFELAAEPDLAVAAQDAGLGNAAVAAEIQDAGEQAAAASATHTVQPGDSLWAIATRYGTTVEALAAANGITDPGMLQEGQTLTIPGVSAPVSDDQQSGEDQQAVDARDLETAPDNADLANLNAVSDTVLGAVPGWQREYAAANVPAILAQCAALGVTDPNQVAYILATAEHESRFGTPLYGRSESLVEDRNPATQNADGSWSGVNHLTGETITGASYEAFLDAYWDACYGGMLGNAEGTGDAADYRGRGFVQLTGRSNYDKMATVLTAQGFSYTIDGVTYGGEGGQAIDLVAHPEHVNLVPELAARVLVTGMMDGDFTGVALPDYVNGDGVDFENARRVVNGDVETNGASIAELAAGYQAALAQWSSVFKESST